jgi:hypothetical protein
MDGGNRLNPLVEPDNVRNVLHVLTGVTATELAALRKDQRWDTTADGGGPLAATTPQGRYTWAPSSTLTADGQLVIAPTDGSDGRFLLDAGQDVHLSFPFTWETADAAALLTMPAGAYLWPARLWWKITADMTGGAGSTIGVSTDVTGYDVKGDLLGGAAGDAAAALTAALSPALGTIGAKWDTVPEKRFMLRPADVLRFDRITSAFTAGAGSVEMTALVVENAGS